MNKKINYLARSFNDIKAELISFSKKYYPEISDDFNDSSVGSWFIDLVSAVGDNLSYHTDRMYQENNINSANLRSTLLNNARLNAIHVPGPKASMCEVEISCVLPLYDRKSGNIAQPDWSVAPIIKSGSVVGNSNYQFETIEDVDFSCQFNSDGVSNRKFVPNKDNNGIITAYTATKSTVVFGGKSKIYKKVLTEDDVKPFMEIILPEKNIMNVESVIFKETSNFNSDPKSYEYYVDKEKYKFDDSEIYTYRYFETDSLSDQFKFGTKIDEENGKLTPYEYEKYKDDDDIRRYYQGEWKPITQKFVTEYTDNGYLKLIFGSGTLPKEIDTKNMTTPSIHMMSKIINNDLLGVLPKIGWTMFVLYRTSGGISTNLAQGAINSVITANVVFKKDNNNKEAIVNSLTVNNITPSIGGKDFLSNEEVKNFIKYSIPEQKRCVVINDYKARLMSMPPKYGCPFRCGVMEDNNKISMSCLFIDRDGKLKDEYPEQLSVNIKEYLSHYKTIGDYLQLKSGKYYNIGFIVSIMIDKNYSETEVSKNVIEIIKKFMDISKYDIGEDIFIGELEKEITLTDGVLNLINLQIFSLPKTNNGSSRVCPLPKKYKSNVGSNGNCSISEPEQFPGEDNKKSFEIDLSQLNNILPSDYDSMYEIRNSETDIIIKTKIR